MFSLLSFDLTSFLSNRTWRRNLFIWIGILCFPAVLNAKPLHIASKKFVESYILAEIMSQLLESYGYAVKRKYNLGGTLICYQALRTRQIDVYPEYTGTIQKVILKSKKQLSLKQINHALETHGLKTLAPLGFNNSYALALSPLSKLASLEKISDLAKVQTHSLNIALSYEFLRREDGWQSLRAFYAVKQKARGIEHALAYDALAKGQIDITDVYSTDAEIKHYGLKLLKDDQNFFPQYLALPLIHNGLNTEIRKILRQLGDRLSNVEMQALNAKVLIEEQHYAQIAAAWLQKQGLVKQSTGQASTLVKDLISRTARHIQLSFIALFFAALIGFGLGIIFYRRLWAARVLLYITGLLQTIPSIALLALMIPLLGIGLLPAVTALFLYALLPIVRSSITALQGVDPLLLELARAMGFSRWHSFYYVELPLSLPVIFSGLRTAAVISVGTATLAAFIGAGGLGDPIVTGLALNNPKLILEGAIPAAMLAIFMDIAFDAMEGFIVPAHLRTRG